VVRSVTISPPDQVALDKYFSVYHWEFVEMFGSGVDPFTVNPGDTLDFTVNFTTPLSLKRPTAIELDVSPLDGVSVLDHGQFEFLGATGAIEHIQDARLDHFYSGLGLKVYPRRNLDPSYVTVTGIEILDTVDGLRSYPSGTTPTNGTFGSGFFLEWESGTPEPATWISMILGMGATGAAMRRRRRAPPRPA
jgi:hypothetical protein